GSVTESVLRGGDCPVLSVNRKGRLLTPDPVKKILCPVNFSDVARASLEYASRLAATFDCELAVVHVVEDEDKMHALAAQMDVRSWIDPAVQNRCTYRELVLRGGAAERVLDCAEDLGADMIVIGAQHKRFRDETVIGTTTERLVRFADVPVLSVPRRVEAMVPQQPEEQPPQVAQY
ncbi:MAG: universal stress protein, partial [Acidobacteriota bacterium]